MKVLHVSYYDNIGGASVAMTRIHDALLCQGIDSKILVCIKGTDSKFVMPFADTKFKVLCAKVKYNIFRYTFTYWQLSLNKTWRSYNILASRLPDMINKFDVDIVHLHWIGKEFLAIKDIKKINKKLVWTFHDLWPILGAEHYDFFYNTKSEYGSKGISFSGRYQRYSNNNKSASHRGIDIDKWIWKKKLKYWKDVKMNVVTISNWQEKIVRDSPIFKNKSIKTIGNPIDTNFWNPYNKEQARKELNISQSKKVIAFGAYNSTTDKLKGIDLLIQSLSELKRDDIQLLIFGNHTNIQFDGIDIRLMGFINDQDILKKLYSAADVTIVPSLQEAFGQTALESLACGTPVVAFAVGGLLDIVDHKKDGYLAIPYDTKDLSYGVNWILDSKAYGAICQNAIENVKLKFASDVIAQKYIEVYNK